MPKISTEEFNALMAREMPWAVAVGMTADAIGRGTATVRLPFDHSMLRPGGPVPGPTLMPLAYGPMYALGPGRIGGGKLRVATLRNPGADARVTRPARGMG